MEMEFDKIPVTYLQKVASQLKTQEQTLEVRLPEGMPDIGHVLGAWGQVIVRGKEWNGDNMAVSCGVMVWVLYVPEDEEGVRSVEAWLPFMMKWELPESRYDGKILTACHLRSVDARSTSARKLMIRATLGAMGEAWQQEQLQVPTPGQLPQDTEVLTETYPVYLPKEMGEKAFLLEEQLSLPGGMQKPEKLLYYSLQPEIADEKVMAGKVVFRGKGVLHLLYQTEDGKLCAYDWELPFSQYADLDGEYDQDPSVSVQPCVTSLDVDLDENGQLQCKAGILGQYLLHDRDMLTVAKDAYSPVRTVIPTMEQLPIPAVLEQTSYPVNTEQTLQADAQQVVDVIFSPEFPQTERTEQGAALYLSGQFQLLYYDPEGELATAIVATEEQLFVPGAMDSYVDARMTPVGRPQAIPGAGNVILRSEMNVDTVVNAGQGIEVLSGMELGELQKPDRERPTLILCRMGGDSLWEIAKRTGSTVDKIKTANSLGDDVQPDRILLIPVS